ncbi:major facilitator superfamily domain-containing protein [Leucosporidium creatinivorum]|uniref:Major facilitator superfamily domain-containing protein n=1 Tax=Leucosporidium creatinivorum TaxID=106004 RepID=A0A1Y2F4Y9_9BASI|nr:major facilitator superfamily domain-containing protein [Leucosporidium creatinivorum]
MSSDPTPASSIDEKREPAPAADIEGGHLGRTDSEIEKDGGEVQLFRTDAAAAGLKTAADGVTVLLPQPSDDPNDPLNWSSTKKHTILLILAFAAFCGDFQSGAGIPLLSSQAAEWGMTLNDVNKAGNLNVLLLGLGGLVWIPPLYFWGRLPVLFWTQFLGTMMILGSVLVTNFDQYYALRPLTSLFLTASQTIGLTFLKDMFYFHEHARKIGIWIFIFLCSPYCGPFFGGFMVDGLNGEWRPVLWLVFAFSVAILLAVIFLADETWYDRTLAVQPERETGVLARIKKLVGITAFQQRQYKASVAASCLRLGEVCLKPVIWMVFVIYALAFMWAVGINITSSILFATPKAAGGYELPLTKISGLYATPLVALWIGEMFGHWANDAVANWYTRRNKGVFVPECRLFIFFVASFLMIPGLVIVGQALHLQLNIAAVIIGWGMYVVGVMVASVAVTAYVLDCYPSASGEVSALVNLSRTISGFSVGYYQMSWGEKAGFNVSFGIQAAIVAGATILVAILIITGARLRHIGGPLRHSAH